MSGYQAQSSIHQMRVFVDPYQSLVLYKAFSVYYLHQSNDLQKVYIFVCSCVTRNIYMNHITCIQFMYTYLKLSEMTCSKPAVAWDRVSVYKSVSLQTVNEDILLENSGKEFSFVKASLCLFICHNIKLFQLVT